jgi:hypothetical protein
MKLHDVDLNKIATFLAIAESASVTVAAAQLALTRSAALDGLMRRLRPARAEAFVRELARPFGPYFHAIRHEGTREPAGTAH